MEIYDAPEEPVDCEVRNESGVNRPSHVATPRVFGASVIGPLHIEKGIPCQDACAFSILPCGLGVIAVADGLGSASMSEVGAKLAVEAAVQSVNDALAESDTPHTPLEEIVSCAVHSARKMLEQKSVEEQRTLRDLACTIIVTVFEADRLAVGHIGDGAVVGQAKDGLQLLSCPGESEYTNEVVPLTSSDWLESLRIVPTVSGVECVAVFTDGCQRAALRRSLDKLEPFAGFFDPIFSYARELLDQAEAEREIRALLSSKKMCENSEDDKTLVVAVLGRG